MGLDKTPNSFVDGEVPLSDDETELVRRRQGVMAPTYRLMYQRPLTIVSGEGLWLTDKFGNRYLDFYNNVASLGHCHPHVVAATVAQTKRLASNTRYLHEGTIETTEALLSHFPDDLDRVIYTCTGSEANDLSLRFAFKITGGTGVIVSDYAYHGTSALTASVSPNLGPMVPLAAGVRRVPAPYGDEQGQADRFRDHVLEAIGDLERHGITLAALIIDSLLTSDGVFPGRPGFLQPAITAVRQRGGMVIADEVQAGFARTGSHYWGFERHGIAPDFVTLGKPMGNGYPVAAVVTKERLLAEFAGDLRYFNTFGGNTVATAVAKAVMEVIEDEALQENAVDVGRYFLDALEDVATRRPALQSVRGQGLYLGADIVDPGTGVPSKRHTTSIVNGLRDRGILISICGPNQNVLKIRPPLISRKSDVDQFIAALDDLI